MDEKRNRSEAPEHGSAESMGKITLFGKRMDMVERGAAKPADRESPDAARQGYDDADERRIFWLVVGTFAVVLVAAFVGAQFWRWKGKAPSAGQPAAQSRPETPAAGSKPSAQPAAPAPRAQQQPAPQPPPAAGPKPGEPPAAPASALQPRAEEEKAPKPSAESAQPEPTAVPVAQPHGGRQARRSRGRAKAPVQRSPESSAYIQRLREQMQQYEREKAKGKYQEFPK